jgi:hypothetical protein
LSRSPTKRQLTASWQIPKLLLAREPHYLRNIIANHTTPDDLGDRHIRPRPRRPARLLSATPQGRRRRLRPDADGAAVVDAGAGVGGDAADVNGGQNG